MNIYSTEEFENATLDQLKKIDKALVAAAYRIKDNAQEMFINNGKYQNLAPLKDGLMLGKLENSSIRLHAFGYNDAAKQTFKARFFVGGAENRFTKSRKGSNTRPLSRGSIQALDTIDRVTSGSEGILDNYIRTALNNG